MKFFFDNCLSPKLAAAMKAMGVDVVHLQERFGADTLDEVWMPKLAGEGVLVVTTDRRIYTNDTQRAIARKHGLVFFVLASSFENQKAMEQLSRLAIYWPFIEKQGMRVAPGQFWLLQLNGKMELGELP